MNDTDQLKELLSNINLIHDPIDLEDVIMESIVKEIQVKGKIAHYRKQGMHSLIFSLVLVLLLVLIYSFQTVDNIAVMYTSIVACLILLFVQVELSGVKFIHQIKNNSL